MPKGGNPRVISLDEGEPPRSVVLGTAGHIDHGKTSLVLALTGVDADRLPEEKARGITIDLGFAAMDLVGANGRRYDVSLVDVPGHHAFVRNMLAGAGGIDAVMLVIAADEGVKAQTREHFEICRLLGMGDGVVVLSKSDAATAERMEEVRREVRTLVAGSFLERAAVLAVSARRGDGLEALRAKLGELCARVPRRVEGRIGRLPIDRAFSMRGFGTIVTGTLQAGRFRAGQSPVLQPGARKLRVRGVQVHGHGVDEAVAPNRVALNLAGVEVGDVKRGDVLVADAMLEPVRAIDVEIDLLDEIPALRHRQRVRVHALTSETVATVLLYEGGFGKPLARLKLQDPIVLVPGDRFVLRQPSPARTLGGGVVLDAHPLGRGRKATVALWLDKLRREDESGRLRMRVERRGSDGLTPSQLMAETGWDRHAIEAGLAAFLKQEVLIHGPSVDSFVAAEVLSGLQPRILHEVTGSGSAGLSRAELLSKLRVPAWIVERALKALLARGQVRSHGDRIITGAVEASGGAGPANDPRTAAVERIYREAGLASPLVAEVGQQLRMADRELRTSLTALLRAGTLLRLGSDALLVHRAAVDQLVMTLRQKRGQAVDVGQFKSLTGLTRKHAIPMLEYLDGAHVLRNAGGTRTIL